MCRWLAYSGDEIFLEDLLFKPEHSLVEQSQHATEAKVATNGDGFGVGWYGQQEEPGLYREIMPAWNDCNLRHLARQIKSSHFFAHVRASTGTATSRANCHPFAYENWMGMHNGQVGGYEQLRRPLEAHISDCHYLNRMGTTDSEALFYMLFCLGLEENPVKAICRMVSTVETLQKEKEITAPFRCTMAITDGKRLFSLRHASDSYAPSLYWQKQEGRLVVVSEPLSVDRTGWNKVPESHVLISEGSEVLDIVSIQ
ncbi:class II glutamine amidotransferase [Kiloniella laminariae]|uniref:Class II glutamine amidotransferase n=1 Tax=Kiloniella laminariae TaxID=454162 RepID=A0ABT4LL22_9PROT|nr:class II glutamine amidotransferase [Kiloniella laminariae]MCZ4281801.1 class II glutamine amidotransferase [Kiloniella laminariae]